VSVLLPVYDAASTLEACLDSLGNQTLTDIEIVAVDDGSTDDSAAILDERAKADPRIRVLHRDHQGVVDAAQAGLVACRGRYVARMDADDLAYPERLAKQVGLFAADPALKVASCLVEVLDAAPERQGFVRYVEWVNSAVEAADIERERFIELPMPNPTTMARRVDLLKIGGIRETGWPEDYELWLRAAHAGWRMAKVPEVLLGWRDGPDRLTRTDSRYSVENFLRAKSHYLARGPLAGRPVIMWGAGKMGRRLSKHLLRHGVDLVGFVDIDQRKIGGTSRNRPVHDVVELPALLDHHDVGIRPVVLAAVSSYGARALIRERLNGWGLTETVDYWCAA